MGRSRLVWLMIGVASLGALGFSEPAVAAEDSPKQAPDLAKARRLAREGIERFHQQRYREAKSLLSAAEQLHPAAVHKVYLARIAALERSLLEAARLYALAQREAAGSEVAEVAARERAEVVGRTPHLVLEVPRATSGTSVWLDGEAIDWTPGQRLAVDPGLHVIERRDGERRRSKTLRVAEGAESRVELLLPAEVAPRKTKPAEQADSNAAAWTALGLGGVSTLIGAVVGTIVLTRSGELREACAEGCPASRQSDLDDTRLLGNISTVAFVVGGLGLATGLVLWVTPGDQAGARDTALTVAGRFW